MRRRYVVLIVAVMACGRAADMASAATFDWTNTGSGTYSNSANWAPAGGPPGSADTARFALNANSNVTFSANATLNILTMSQGNVTFFLNGFTYQPTNTVSNGMGSAGVSSSLRILNGTFLPGNFSVGGNSGSNSVLTLDSNLVTNVGAGVFYVGTSGTGHVNIQTGADLTTSASTGLGINASGVGSATVTGSGSTWTVNNTLRVGSAGTGTLNVLNGGVVTVNALEVAESFNSAGTLNLSGANAVLTSSGTANFGGSSSLFPAASSTVNIGTGATLNLNGTANLRTSATVNMTGGTLNLNTLSVTPGAVVNWSGGKISFANGSSVTGPVLDLLLAGTHTLGVSRTLSASAGTMDLDTALAVNGGRLEAAILDINAPLGVGAFGVVSASDTLAIQSGQTVQIEDFGSLGAAVYAHNNGGTLKLNGPQATVSGFFANNFGTVEGTGRFAAGMNNGTGGTIRARAGDHLVIAQSGLTNPGIIELAGGTIEYTNVLSNLANGSIIGRGVFRGGTASPGGNGLSNIGLIALSGGTTDFHGDVLNSGAGRIVASGGSVVTFFDDVTHNGAEVRTNAGSRTVFFGGLTGAGPFTGTGIVEINGDLKPGNSPALVAFDGAVELGSAAELSIELGGRTAGTSYDRVSVGGLLSLDGMLHVSLVNGFSPALGDSFDVLDWGSLNGTFDQVSLPPLAGGLAWDQADLYATGSVQVVPEPAALIPAVLAFLMAVGRRKRRAGP